MNKIICMDPNEYEIPDDKKVRRTSKLRLGLGLGIILIAVIGIAVLAPMMTPPARVLLIGFCCALALNFILRMRRGGR